MKIEDLKHMEKHASFIVKIHFKGAVSVISCDPQCKEGNARFTTTVPLKPLCVLPVQKHMCV